MNLLIADFYIKSNRMQLPGENTIYPPTDSLWWSSSGVNVILKHKTLLFQKGDLALSGN